MASRKGRMYTPVLIMINGQGKNSSAARPWNSSCSAGARRRRSFNPNSDSEGTNLECSQSTGRCTPKPIILILSKVSPRRHLGEGSRQNAGTFRPSRHPCGLHRSPPVSLSSARAGRWTHFWAVLVYLSSYAGLNLAPKSACILQRASPEFAHGQISSSYLGKKNPPKLGGGVFHRLILHG